MYLIGRINTSKFPPQIDMIRVMESPAGSLTSFGREHWVELLPTEQKTTRLDICLRLIEMQDYYRWMEPLLDPGLAVECLRLQGIDEAGLGFELHKLQWAFLDPAKPAMRRNMCDDIEGRCWVVVIPRWCLRRCMSLPTDVWVCR